jgi:hypothetical protein
MYAAWQHCSVRTPAEVSIVVGEHDRSDDGSTVRQTMFVSSIHVHPDYSSSTMAGDIALVELESAIQFNDNVAPVCAGDGDDQYAYRKSQCSGWGTLSSGKVVLDNYYLVDLLISWRRQNATQNREIRIFLSYRIHKNIRLQNLFRTKF